MRFLPMVLTLQFRQMFGLRGLWIGLIRLDMFTPCKFVVDVINSGDLCLHRADLLSHSHALVSDRLLRMRTLSPS
jgi:hypothetical protein